MIRPPRHILIAAIVALVTPIVAGSDVPQRSEKVPVELERVGVEEHLGNTIPLDLVFTDEHGDPVRLAEFFQDGHPVVLNLGYYGCPMLCGLVLNGLLEAANDSDLAMGEDYTILTVSIDPAETHQLAYVKKKNVLEALAQPGRDAGWRFLTGKPEAIESLTHAVGFGYEWVERRKEFAHTAVLMVLTPEGKISRYLYGIKYPERTFRLSLVEAARGDIGSTIDRVLLYCFQYDRHAGEYTLAAMNVMRLAALGTMTLLGTCIAVALVRESRRRQLRESAQPGDEPGA